MEVSVRLVGSAAFKAVGTSDPRPAGSIPVHLRQFARRRLRTLLACAVGFIIVMPAGPALADPAKPGNTESIVESLSPANAAVRFDIVAGDAFLRVRVERGHVFVMPGYYDEPFLRVTRDGTVSVNEASETFRISGSRYGTTSMGEVAVATPGQPTWVVVSNDGTYLWHDHRVHWMSPAKPTAIDDRGLVQQWSLPFSIDGVKSVASGSLYLRDAPTSWWWLAAVPAVVGGLFLGARNRRGLVAVASVGVCAVGALTFWGLPTEARSAPTAVVLGLAGFVIATVAQLMRRQREVADALLASAGTALIVAVVLARAMVTHRFVPGIDDAWWVRAVIPIAGGAAVGATVSSVRGLLGRN